MENKKLNPEKIQQWLVNRFSKELRIEKEKIDINRCFANFGLGSMQSIGITGDLEKWIGEPIPPTILFEHDNIRKLTFFLSGAEINPPQQMKTTKKPNAITKKSAGHKILKLKNLPEINALLKYRKEVEKTAGMQLYFCVNEGISSNTTEINGESYINFSSYNYIGMSGDKEVTRSTLEAIKENGSSVSGSRLVGGEKLIHAALEREISTLLNTEDCIAFNSGHATNVTTIGHMMKKNDLLLLDRLSHNSIVQGAQLSGATIKFFQHNDPSSLETILRESRAAHDRALIVTEGVFSMDGDIPPLPEFITIKNQHQALLYVDEAHSLGVLGKTGKGISEYFKLKANDIDFWMGTLSKALGSSGGYIAGCKELVEYLRFSAPGFVYSCGLSPADTAAALASVQKLQADPAAVTTLQQRSKFFLTLLNNANINTGSSAHTPVIPIIVGDSDLTIKLCAALRRQRIYTQALFYPVVENNASRLRFFITSSHSEKQLQFTANKVIEEMEKLNLL